MFLCFCSFEWLFREKQLSAPLLEKELFLCTSAGRRVVASLLYIFF